MFDRILRKLRDKEYRDSFVRNRTRTFVALQIKILRERSDLSQKQFAKFLNKKQSAISRLEDPNYGRFTITTLLDIARAMDIALIVEFVSYKDFLARASDMSPERLKVPNFSETFKVKEPSSEQGEVILFSRESRRPQNIRTVAQTLQKIKLSDNQTGGSFQYVASA